MPSYPQWEADVLDECYDNVDYLSLHMYFENYEDDYLNFLAKPVILDRYIQTVSGVIDYVKAKKRSKKDIYISFDEWNVWYHSRRAGPQQLQELGLADGAAAARGGLQFRGCAASSAASSTPSSAAPTGCGSPASRSWSTPSLRSRPSPAGRRGHTIYYPYLFASRYGRGESLAVAVDAPRYDAKAADDVPYVDVAAVLTGGRP